MKLTKEDKEDIIDAIEDENVSHDWICTQVLRFRPHGHALCRANAGFVLADVADAPPQAPSPRRQESD
jgi:hypothetical protein